MKKTTVSLLLFLCFQTVNSQEHYIQIADSLYKLSNYTAAINAYAKVATPYTNLQTARAYNAIGNYDKAVLQYEDFVTKNQRSLIGRYELGKLYHKVKSFDKSVAIYLTLIKDDRQNAAYYYGLGLALKALDQKRASVEAFKKCVRIDSTHLNGIYQLSRSFLSKKKNDSVIKYADLGLAFYENSARLINVKAQALFSEERYKMALPLFEKLVKLGQEEEFIYDRLGSCYVSEKMYEKAIEAYDALLAFNPTNHKALNALGHIFWEQKNYKSAIAYIKASIAIQRVSFDKEYVSLARISLDEKELKKAIDYYMLAEKEAPYNANYSYQIAFLADTYFKDPKLRLSYFEKYQKKFGDRLLPFNEYVTKRISELKAEIHLAE